ncbi:MAG TPA: hypothetical protein PK530_03180 [Anaerolineales bacterium]|nr:hypothetical protein [Anaerolineales bacterium]
MYPSSSPPPGGIHQREYENLIREGMTAAKGGNRALARRLLTRANMLQPNDARPYLWLSATTDDPYERRDYLEKALACDANLEPARKGLMKLNQQLGINPEEAAYARDTPSWTDADYAAERDAHPSEDAAPAWGEESAEDGLVEGETEIFECPMCGWRMSFDPVKNQMYCESCGHIVPIKETLAADTAEAPMSRVMHTAAAHLWAAHQHRVECAQCGAVTIQESVQKSGQCPYCGHNQLVDSKELRELIDPQVVALFKVKEKLAHKLARDWLNSGLFAPDDLGDGAKGLQMRPAYYPFWTFDGAVEARWTCEVDVSHNSRNPMWVQRDGMYSEFFDDVLVPGVTVLNKEDVASIEPFNLKDVVAFKAEHLAGWPTLSYDRAMSDASLFAREKVVRELRPRMHGLIEPGMRKRNVQVGAGAWSGMTYKHVLLPLWVGTYHYNGEEFHVLVNGQTRKVGGKKPQDKAKVFGVWAIVAGLLILLALGLTWLIYTYQDQLTGLFQAAP